MLNFIHNEALSRFELHEQGHIAHADYKQEGQVVTIRLVFAPEALRGTGAAGRLMERICGYARTQGLKILTLCGYAAAWLQKHQEHHDLMA
jgi:uncharacterized protein